MSIRVITSVKKQRRDDDRFRDMLIGISASAFAVGVVFLLMMLPAPKVGADALDRQNASQTGGHS